MRKHFKAFPAGFVGYLFCLLPVSANQIYVASYENGALNPSGVYIDKVDAQGHSSPFAYNGSLFYPPESMVYDGSGNLYVSIEQGNQIYRYNSSGQAALFASAGLSRPRFLTFSPGGQLYAININDHSIVRFDAQGNPTVFANTGIFQPSFLAFDSSGNLYTTIGSTTILKYNPQGQVSTFAGVNSPWGLAFHDNYLYVATAYQTILRFNPLGNGSLFSSPGVDSSRGMVFDGNGFLYTIEGFDTITRIDQAGNASTFATLGSKFLYGIAVVPEPAQGTFLILGLGVYLGNRLQKRKPASV